MMRATIPTPQLNVQMRDPRTGAVAEWTALGEFLGRDILLLRDAFPFARELAAVAEAANAWTPSTVINAGAPSYLQLGHRSSESCAPRGVPALHPFIEAMVTLEVGLARLYTQEINPHARVRNALGWEILRYKTGAYFKEHIDVVPGDAILAQRTLALVGFCNDDFEGGELVFPRQGITIKPEAGAVVIFPATFTHPHEARAVTRGTRYSLVTWFGHFPTSP